MRGSFTGAVKDKAGLFTAAAKGTFFLDEIGETTPSTQVKLLRVLQHRQVIPVGATEPVPIDTRLIAATNRDLEDMLRRGTFRQDLFYRLNVIAVHLPPLRERRDDIPHLVETFLERLATQRAQDAEAPEPAGARDRGVVSLAGQRARAGERAGACLDPHHRHDDRGRVAARSRDHAHAATAGGRPRRKNPTLDTIERAYILWVLESEGGNKTRAAETLGIDPSTLHRKLSRFGSEE